MEEQFYTLYDFMLGTQSVICIMIGIILVLFLASWSVLFGRDKTPID